jgi:hypothetical protein
MGGRRFADTGNKSSSLSEQFFREAVAIDLQVLRDVIQHSAQRTNSQ